MFRVVPPPPNSFSINRLVHFIFIQLLLVTASTHVSQAFDNAERIVPSLGFNFSSWPSNSVVRPGTSLSLSCSTSLPVDVIRWQRDHRFLSAEAAPAHVQVISASASRLHLQLSNESEEAIKQEGLYQCVATLGAVSLSSLPGRVKIASWEKVGGTNTSIEGLEGDALSIKCSPPTSVPPVVVTYYKDGRQLDIIARKDIFESQPGVLLLQRLSLNSSGYYSCAFDNQVLKERRHPPWGTTLSVERRSRHTPPTAPSVVTFPHQYALKEGVPGELLCLAKGHPSPRVKWTHGGHRVRGPPGTKRRHLSFDSPVISDSGVYRCHATSRRGEDFVDVEVTVSALPTIIDGPQCQQVPEGASVVLSCTIGGSPPPHILWTFNGKPLNGWPPHNESLVRLLHVSPHQAGVYQCFALNSEGAAEGSCVLGVVPKTVTLEKKNFDGKDEKRRKNKKPKVQQDGTSSYPSRPNATQMSDTSALVSWFLKGQRGLPILFFRLQYKDLSDEGAVGTEWRTLSADIPPHVFSHEVFSLTPGHQYRFRVAAVYINNDNQHSKASKKILLKRSDLLLRPSLAPTIIEVTSINPEGSEKIQRGLKVEWAYSNDEMIEGFIIFYRDSIHNVNFTKVAVFGRDERSHVILNLQSDSMYDFKIKSFNTAGSSPFSMTVTYKPFGSNSRSDSETLEGQFSSPPPTVLSDPPPLLSPLHLYIALGLGLGLLMVLVIVSFVIYSCRNHDDLGHENVEGKYIDTSLRIHRLTTQQEFEAGDKHCSTMLVSESRYPPLLNQPNSNISQSSLSQLQHPLPHSSNHSSSLNSTSFQSHNSFTKNSQ